MYNKLYISIYYYLLQYCLYTYYIYILSTLHIIILINVNTFAHKKLVFTKILNS